MAKAFKKSAPKKKSGKSLTAKVAASRAKSEAKKGKADQLRALREAKAGKAVPETNALAVPRNPTTVQIDGEAINLSKLKSLDDFRAAGLKVWKRTLGAVFQMSELLDFAHDKLKREDYATLIVDLNISEITARQMRAVSASARMRELYEAGKLLPSTSHTLYLLSAMDDKEYKAFDKQVGVSPQLTAEEVRDFRSAYKAKLKGLPAPPTTSARLASRHAAREFAETATAPTTIEHDPNEVRPTAEEASGSPDIEETAAWDQFRELGDGILSLDTQSILNTAPDLKVSAQFCRELEDRISKLAASLEDKDFESAA
jgi:hypothetical protein